MMHVRAIPQIPGARRGAADTAACPAGVRHDRFGWGFDGGSPAAPWHLQQRALARLVTDNGYFNDPVARISLPAGLNDRSTAVLGALLRSAPVQRELAIVVNRAAGDAADRAAPLIYDSIRSLTFSDAVAIVRGGPTAATSYLERVIGDRIIDAMFPEVGDALHQFGSGSILGPVLGASTGIDIPAIQRAVTDQASQGLWRAIGREEAAIRAEPARAGDPLVEGILTGRVLN